ncbi:MAG TPA: CPBP family intramembrane glutamic endopeptidase [Ignavibacteria bacterium]
MQISNLLFSSIIQTILFSIIPFIWWVISAREQSTFSNWLGISKPIILNKKKYVTSLLLVLSLLLILTVASFLVIPQFVNKSNLATSQFVGKSMSTLISILIYAFLQTGFSEELFFRGFLSKRLIDKYGFKIGNIIQSLVFGLMHGLFFISLAGILGTIIIIAITSTAGWIMGWFDEKKSGGSIVPSWLFHGCTNTLAAILNFF